MKNKILIFQRVNVHYRKTIFKELNKLAGVIVCFGKKGPPQEFHLKTKADFPHFKVNAWYPSFAKHSFVIQDVITPLFKFRPTVVILEFSVSIISNWLVLFLRWILGYRIILWGHGYNRKTHFFPSGNLLDKIRLWWIDRADAVILYSAMEKAIIMPYTRNPQRIFVAQNTLDTARLIKIRERLQGVGRVALKRKLELKENYNLIYLGRFLKDKEPDRLINVFKILSKRLESVGLHFVGDGPLLHRLKEDAVGLKVRFWGGISDDEEISKLLFASDLMVIPGYLGLAVVHAFCFDIPVVSQKESKDGPFHSPEIEYVIDGKTGFLTEYGDNQKIADTIFNYLMDSALQRSMKEEIRKTIETKCAIENMVSGFKEALGCINRN